MQAGAIAVGRNEGAEQAADGDALGSLAAGAQDQDLLAHGGRILVAGGSGAQGGPGQPAGQQLTFLNPNAGRTLVWETAMVDLGSGAEADQVLDEAGEGGDIGNAAEDGDRARAVQQPALVIGLVTLQSACARCGEIAEEVSPNCLA